MKFEVLSLKNKKEWSDLLSKLPIEQQDIYFTPEYYELYENNGDGKAQCFVFEDNDDIALYPFLINSVNKSGYDLDDEYFDIQGAYGYNGVVTTSNEKNFIKKFYLSFDEYCKNENIIAEFTRFHPLINNSVFSEEFLQIVPDRKTIYIDLQKTYEELFSKFQTTTRKQIKRAIYRHKIEVKWYEKDVTQLNIFLDIYNETMDRVNSIPYLYFNKQYFKSLIETTNNVCFEAIYQGKPIAAILVFYNQTYLHGHLGGALTEYLSMSPYSLLYSEIIKFGQMKGCKYFHIGGGATANINDPLLQYKLHFSQTTLDFYIGKKIHNQKIYDEVVKQWETKFPEKKEKYNNLLLKYRY
ncbi:MAG: GNAT family N-acetyltransferase [Bacteroidales bacterium]|nr:GNAT family N-acetyltransferase [Bacteroidales bacterium]